MLQVILAILAFCFLVFMHELGHFAAAKLSGVQVNEFWIGMGPNIVSKEINGTLYCLKWLPFGGACVMEGEDEESESDRSFQKASLPRRMAIILAGPIMNFIVGFLIVLCLVGFRPWALVSTTISGFNDGFAYSGETMLMEGDEILSIDGYRVLVRSDVETGIAYGADDGVYTIVVKRDGEKVQLRNLPLTKDFVNESGTPIFGIQFEEMEKNIGSVLVLSAKESVNYARMVWDSVVQLVTGKVGVGQLSGPVGVADVMATQAKQSLYSFFTLVAFISINLGLMNLLPIPALDGGRFLFLLIEAVFRRPVPAKYEAYVHAAGFALLIGLLVFVTGQDILRIIAR